MTLLLFNKQTQVNIYTHDEINSLFTF